MKLVVSGKSTKTGKWVHIVVPCEQSVFTCSMGEQETSLTTYLEDTSSIKVLVFEPFCTTPHEVENTDDLYYHICLWDRTDVGLLDATIDFKVFHAKWTVYADDYDEANIRCSRD